jgi:hypothetical protein
MTDGYCHIVEMDSRREGVEGVIVSFTSIVVLVSSYWYSTSIVQVSTRHNVYELRQHGSYEDHRWCGHRSCVCEAIVVLVCVVLSLATDT